tara:strand:- start:28 stop:408 length:381 start_codon:yes stop_codon:yes gene_type:complete
MRAKTIVFLVKRNLKMRVKLEEHTCVITRGENDPKYYGTLQGRGESNLLHALKIELNKQGFDFIKKRMWKDGHMVDDMQQYLRERSPVNGRQLCIYNDAWAVEGANDLYNDTGTGTFRVVNLLEAA